MEVPASVTVLSSLNYEKWKICVMEDVMCHPDTYPFNNKELITLETGIAMGRQPSFVRTFQ